MDDKVTYMFCRVGLEAIDPTVANTVAELLLLPIKDVLQRQQGRNPSENSLLAAVNEKESVDENLWQVGVLLIIKSLPQYPLLDPTKIRLDLIMNTARQQATDFISLGTADNLFNVPFSIQDQCSWRHR